MNFLYRVDLLAVTAGLLHGRVVVSAVVLFAASLVTALCASPPAAAQVVPHAAGADAAPRPDAETLRRARIAGHVLPGMTRADVLASAGKYRDHAVSGGVDAHGPYEIWTFDRRMIGFPMTVVFRRGAVVQFADGPLPYITH
jgi:hypothetical protein